MKPLLENDEQDLAAMAAMCRETAELVRAANRDRAAIVAAIEHFLDFGDAGEYSPKELWYHFASSSPSVPQLAGCDATAEDRLIRIFSTCTYARYGDGKPLGADWPWYERDEPGQLPHQTQLKGDLSGWLKSLWRRFCK